MKLEIDIDDIMPQILLEKIGNVYTDITNLKAQEVLKINKEEDSHVGVWLIPPGEELSSIRTKTIFLSMVRAEQELVLPVCNKGQVVIRIRKYGWLPLEFHWPQTAEADPLINIHQIQDGVVYAE